MMNHEEMARRCVDAAIWNLVNNQAPAPSRPGALPWDHPYAEPYADTRWYAGYGQEPICAEIRRLSVVIRKALDADKVNR